MNDIVLVAVINAGKNLLHQNGAVSLGELAALEDLIEKLTTLADSK